MLAHPHADQAVFVLGNFDGVHRGHQSLILSALTTAHAHTPRRRCVVLTFWPHPQAVLKPGTPMDLLLTEEERMARLKQLGVDDVLTLEFTQGFSELSWQGFIDTVLLRQVFPPAAVFVGTEFHFGRNREGNATRLKERLSPLGIDVCVQEKVKDSAEDISSSRIRRLLQKGKITEANQLLGYAHEAEGWVRPGDGRGKSLGFPTANVHYATYTFAQKILPPGVSITRTKVDGKTYPSVSNVGTQPTFHDDTSRSVRLETHLLNEQMDLYGRHVRVEFLEHLREETRFADLNALKVQIERDSAAAKDYWATHQ